MSLLFVQPETVLPDSPPLSIAFCTVFAGVLSFGINIEAEIESLDDFDHDLPIQRILIVDTLFNV